MSPVAGFTALWGARVPWGFYLGFGLAVIASALSFYTLPQASLSMLHKAWKN